MIDCRARKDRSGGQYETDTILHSNTVGNTTIIESIGANGAVISFAGLLQHHRASAAKGDAVLVVILSCSICVVLMATPARARP